MQAQLGDHDDLYPSSSSACTARYVKIILIMAPPPQWVCNWHFLLTSITDNQAEDATKKADQSILLHIPIYRMANRDNHSLGGAQLFYNDSDYQSYYQQFYFHVQCFLGPLAEEEAQAAEKRQTTTQDYITADTNSI